MPIDPAIPLGVKMAEITPPEVVMARRNALLQQQQQLQEGQQSLQEGKIKIDEANKARAEQDAVNKLYLSTADASGNVDPQKFLSALGQNNLGHLVPKFKEQFTAADKAASDATLARANAAEAQAKSTAAEADYWGSVGAKIQKSGYDPVVAHIELDAAQKAGHDTTPFQQFLQSGGTLQQAADMVIAGSAQQRKLIADEASAKAAAASAAKTNAEVSGTLPETPTQKSTRLLNEAREAETARHNRATEAAANPLAALTGPGGGAGGVQPSGATAPAQSTPTGPEGPHGDDFLKGLPPAIASEVKAYAEGRRPFPAGFALKSPYFQSLIQMVGQYDPTFDAVNYNARSKTRSDFTSGKSATTINALNTAIGHMDRLSEAADALGNFHEGSLGPLTVGANSLKNAFSKASGNPKATNFQAVVKPVADELTRVWRQSGGTEADIKAKLDSLSSSGSPEQLHGAIAEIGHLLESKLSALQDQYAQGMGTTDTTGMQVVSPAARGVLDKLEKKTSGNAAPATPEGRVRVTGPKGETGTVPKGTALPAGWTATTP